MTRYFKKNISLQISSKEFYLIFTSFILFFNCVSAQTGSFNFNSGSASGWTTRGPTNRALTPLSSNFSSLTWSNSTNYPNPLGSDPSDLNGSVSFSCLNGTGVVPVDSDPWWVMDIVSGNLSTNSNWQTADGYSVRVAENMSSGSSTIYANLYVKVHDNDLGTDRIWYSGTAQPLTRNEWSSFTFNWSTDPNFPLNYTLLEVYVVIWGTVSGYYSGGVYLDEVNLIPGVPGKTVLLSPQNNSTNISINPTLQWQAVSGATYYDLRVFTGGGSQILHDANVTSTSRQIGPLENSSDYVWAVAAGNVNGLGQLSDSFRFTTISVPTLTVSPSNQDAPYTAGSSYFSVASNVSWSASDDASWLTVSPASGGIYDTILTVTYTENTTTSQRVGTITVQGGGITRTVTLTQAAGPTFTVSPSNQSVSYASGTANFSITSNLPGVNWYASDDADWLTVPSGGITDITGKGILIASYTQNTAADQRVATITVSLNIPSYGQITRTVTVTQAPTPVLTVSPDNRAVSNLSGTTTFSVTSNVNWSVSDDATWLTVSPASGSGNGTLTASFTENTSASQRVGTITVSGNGQTRTVTVTQAPASLLIISPSNAHVSYTSGSTQFTITSNIGWSISDDAAWLTVSPSSGSGNGTITATYTENTTTSQRVGTITITSGGLIGTVTVTQDPAPVLTISPDNRAVSYTPGSTQFTVTSNISWSVSDDAAWLTVSPPSGSGNGTITATYQENTTTSQRFGTISITGGGITRTVTVTQAPTPALAITPADRQVSYTSGSTIFTVTSNISWSVSDDAAWLTLSPSSGSGNGTLTATYTENTSTSQRTGTLTVTGGGLTVKATVTQAPTAELAVSPQDQIVPYTSGNTTFTITSNSSWSASDDASWLTVSPSGGTGNGTLTASYTENTTTSQRTGTITVTGSGMTSKVTVTQAPAPMLTVSPSDRPVSYAAGNTSFSVTSNINWSISDDASWLTVSPSSGSNNETLTATYTENTTIGQRIGTITITGSGITRIVTVTQSAGLPALTVSPSDRQVESTSGSTTFTVTSNTSWKVSDDASWLTVSPSSGSNNGTLTATYTENTSTSQRIGIISITVDGINRTVSVTQLPGSANLTVVPTDQSVDNSSGSTTFTVTSNVSWSVSDDASWLTVSPVNGSGSGILTAAYTENTTTSQRIATITVSGGGKTGTVSVTQAAGSPFLIVSPEERSVGSAAGNTAFALESNINWNVSYDASWFKVSPENGSWNSTLTVTYAENVSTGERTGRITVTGGDIIVSLTITQLAGAATLTVNPSERSVESTDGSVAFTLESNISWSASDDAPWLTVSPENGNGNGTITAAYTENTTTSQRKGTITITGSGITRTVIVTQEASSAILAVSPSDQSVGSLAGSTNFKIESNINWSVSDDADWLIVFPISGNGGETITATYTKNSSINQRVGAITVKGGGITRTVTVTQSAEEAELTVSPPDLSVGSEAGSTAFEIKSNLSWNVSDDASWLTVSPASGSNNGTLTVNYESNISLSQRVGLITVSGGGITRTVTVIQGFSQPEGKLAAEFKKPGDYIEVPHSSTINPSQFSIEFWLKVNELGNPNLAGGEQNILDMRGGNDNTGYNIRLAGTKFPVSLFAFVNPGGVQTNEEIYQNVWYHIGITQDKTTLKLYLNGQLIAQDGNIYASNTNSPLRMGDILAYPYASLGLRGEIDELHIWNVVRSPEEVKSDMFAKLSGSEAGLSACWDFNSQNNKIITDLTGNGNNGNLYGNTALVNSDAPVGIVPPVVTNPNGGEKWQVGTQQTITWTSTNVDNVKIEYTSNNSRSWTNIIASIPSNGSYSWTIPNTPSTGCRVRISDVAYSLASDVSDNVFTISTKPFITVNSPNGGEFCQVDSSYNITWSSDNVTNVKIEYSTNNGTNWKSIISSTPSNGSYSWTIPNTPSTSCKVRITDVSNSSISDQSDNVFTINFQPILTVSPSNEQVGSASGTTTFSLTSNVSWSVSDDASWLIVLPTSGSGNETINATYSENTTTDQRIGTITISGGGITKTVTVTQSAAPAPSIITSVNSLSDFGNVTIGQYSAPLSYTVWGSHLTADIEINAPEGFNISLNNASGYANYLTLRQSGGSVDSTVVYVRFSPISVQLYSDVITHNSTGALPKNLNVSGTGIINYPEQIPVNVSYSFPNPTQISNYRIIGIPGANDIPIGDILSGTSGSNGNWRVFWDPGSGDYIEYNGSSLFDFTPGKAFWIISKNDININKNVKSVTLSGDYSFSIPLHDEWNLISNPFDKNIAWDEIKNANPGLSENIYNYNSGSYNASNNFEQYGGYYFYNNPALSMKSIVIPYISAEDQIKKQSLVKSGELEVFLTDNKEIFGEIFIDFSAGAKSGLDPMDKFSPPANFCEIDMALFNADLPTNYKYLKSEFRPAIGEGQEYIIAVKNTTEKVLELKLHGLQNFTGYEVYLFDEERKKVYDLKKPCKVEIKKKTFDRRYKLCIGTEDYLNKKKKSFVPSEFVLFQNYPNPFNPSTTIMFSIPERNTVSLKVYNVLGELVTDLINNETYGQGYYEVLFDAGKLSSGVYFYKIQAGKFVNIKKMILIR